MAWFTVFNRNAAGELLVEKAFKSQAEADTYLRKHPAGVGEMKWIDETVTVGNLFETTSKSASDDAYVPIDDGINDNMNSTVGTVEKDKVITSKKKQSFIKDDGVKYATGKNEPTSIGTLDAGKKSSSSNNNTTSTSSKTTTTSTKSTTVKNTETPSVGTASTKKKRIVRY